MTIPTKISKLKAAAAKGDWAEALRIAARFPELGEHRAAITRAHEAHANARFYRGLGKDPEALIADGIAALKDRYDLEPKSTETKTMNTVDTKLTAVEIAKITAAVEGASGYKRAANKAAAIKRLTGALAAKGAEHRIDEILDAPDLDAARDVAARATETPAVDLSDLATAAAEADAEEAAAEEADAVASLVARGKAKAEAPAEKAEKPKADGPRPGTRARGIFDMLTREGGATAKEMKEAGLGAVSVSIYAQPFAEKYGYRVETTKEGRAARYALIRA